MKSGEITIVSYQMLSRMIEAGQLRIIDGELDYDCLVTVQNTETDETETVKISPRSWG